MFRGYNRDRNGNKTQPVYRLWKFTDARLRWRKAVNNWKFLFYPPARRCAEPTRRRVESSGRRRGGRRAGLTFAMRTRQFSTPSPGSGIGDRSPKQIFSRYGIERAIREATRRKKRGGKGKKGKKRGGKNITFFILDRFVSTLRLTVRPAPLQIPSAFRFVQINQTFREQDSYARHA